MAKKSLHENLGIFIGRLLAQNELTSQPTGSLRYGRVSTKKQLRRAQLQQGQRAYRRVLLRRATGLRPQMKEVSHAH